MAVNTTCGFWVESVLDPTKLYVVGVICHNHDAGKPELLSVKVTVSPKPHVDVGSAVKSASGTAERPDISGLCQTPRP